MHESIRRTWKEANGGFQNYTYLEGSQQRGWLHGQSSYPKPLYDKMFSFPWLQELPEDLKYVMEKDAEGREYPRMKSCVYILHVNFFDKKETAE